MLEEIIQGGTRHMLAPGAPKIKRRATHEKATALRRCTELSRLSANASSRGAA